MIDQPPTIHCEMLRVNNGDRTYNVVIRCDGQEDVVLLKNYPDSEVPVLKAKPLGR